MSAYNNVIETFETKGIELRIFADCIVPVRGCGCANRNTVECWRSHTFLVSKLQLVCGRCRAPSFPTDCDVILLQPLSPPPGVIPVNKVVLHHLVVIRLSHKIDQKSPEINDSNLLRFSLKICKWYMPSYSLPLCRLRLNLVSCCHVLIYVDRWREAALMSVL